MEVLVAPLVSELFKGLFEILGSKEVRDFARQAVVGVDSDLEELEKTLREVEELLSVAEERQLTGKAVKEWLDDLRDWAYDAEDILDEFAYEALRRKLKAEHQTNTTKVLNLVPACFSSSRINLSMRSKIKGITSRLERLCKPRFELKLPGMSSGVMLSNSAQQAPEQRTTSSSVQTEQVVYGRKEDKAKILQMVLSDEPRAANFHVIAIVGMGGIGKTTLAREVYNDKMLDNNQFEEKAWCCVSDNFDVLRISKELLMSIKPSSSSLNNLNEVQVELQKAVNAKKFLFILDDVWDVDYNSWVQLKAPFMAGARGSLLIVTTRDANVASTIRSSYSYDLKKISDEDCWNLFLEHTFGTSTDDRAHEILDSTRKKVVQMCGGLPLAAKTLGGLLGNHKQINGINGWERIISDKPWDSTGINDVLKLSYHHLPSHLKKCFAYCAVYPQDYEFEEEELVLLWMAEGIVQQRDDADGYFQAAGDCFQQLLSRSLFQQSTINCFKYTMHDLIHELAQSVFGEIVRLKLTETLSEKFKRSRHCFYISDRYDGENKFKGIENLRSLRTFFRLEIGDYNFSYITAMVVFDLLPKLQKLRVLSLSNCNISRLPDSIGDLMHLRYLNFSNTQIRSLPDSTSLLFNLQTLLLRDCYRLMKLPSKIRHLTNLCYLDIKGTNSLKEMPPGIKELKNLQHLSKFIVSLHGGSSNLKDLESLSSLRGELHISRLDKLTDRQNISGNILNDKYSLEVLLLEWESESQSDDLRNKDTEKIVLNVLRPHENLKELTFKNYGGSQFPSWLGDSPSLSKLVVLKLEGCKNCTMLPSLRVLTSLEDLTIEGLASLRRMDFQMAFQSLKILRLKDLQECEYWDTSRESVDVKNFPCLLELRIERCPKLKRIDFQMAFQSLKILRLKDLEECEYWDGNRENADVKNFSSLRELHIEGCPKLTGKLPDNLPSLEILVIHRCAELVVSFSSFPMLCKIDIYECKGLVCSRSGSTTDFKSLNSVTLSNIPEFGNWLKQNLTSARKPLHGIHSLTSLKELYIYDCASLVLFPEINFLPNLSSLSIEGCKALQSFHEGMKHSNACLESLTIRDCDSLTFIARGSLPSSLRSVDVSGCKELQCLVVERDDRCAASSSSSLLPNAPEILDSCGCPNMESKAETYGSSMCLREIVLEGCEKLKSTGLHNLQCVELISIRDCPNMISLQDGELPMDCLHKLDLSNCPQLEIPLQLPNSLQHLDIKSPLSFTAEGFPINLTELSIWRNVKFHKPLIELGLENLTSLRELRIIDCPDAEPIFQEDNRIPTSLNSLCLGGFSNLKVNFSSFESLTSLRSLILGGWPELKCLPKLGSLTSLECLKIWDCPKLKCLPNLGGLTSLEVLLIEDCPKLKSFQGLPSSLVWLEIVRCPLLKKKCRRGKGKYWTDIHHIPYVLIDYKFLNDWEEEE